jgi:hypothetical protein
MDALAHLRAGADKRVRIHHRPLVDVGTGINVHRGHAYDAPGDEGAVPYRGSAGDEPDAVRGRETLERVGAPVEEPEPGVDGDVFERAQAEAQEYSFLDPVIDIPATVLLLRRPYISTVQKELELRKYFQRFSAVEPRGVLLVERLYVGLERHRFSV